MGKYTLSEVAPIKQGTVNPAEQYWLLNLDMVESNTGRIIDYLYVQSEDIGSSTISFDTGNVLYSKLRPYLNKVVLPEKDGYATSEMLPLRPDPTILTREYLTYFLRSPQFVAYINEKTSGAKMPRANTSDLKAVEIDCPSLKEQRKITAIFDNIVRIIETRQMELQKLDELVKARFVEMFGSIIETTPKVDFESICEFVSVGIANSATHAFCDDGIIMFRNQNIKEDFLDDSDVVHIKKEFADKYKTKMLEKDDLLIVRTGYPGVACLVPEQYAGSQTFTTLIARLKKDGSINPRYICHYINSEYGKKYVRDNSAGAAQQNFGATALSKMPICVPSIELQNEYIRFIEQLDKSKVVVQKALDEAQLLFDSLMQEYFG